MSKVTRRNTLKGLVFTVPVAWSAPLVQSVLLPVHAQTSPTSPQGGGCGRDFTLESDVNLLLIGIATGTSGEIIICTGDAGGYNELIDVEGQTNFDCFDYTVSGADAITLPGGMCPYVATVSVSVEESTASIDLDMTIDCDNVAGLTGETTIEGSGQFETQIFGGTPGDCETRICGVLTAELTACLDGDETTAQELFQGLVSALGSCEDPCESMVT